MLRSFERTDLRAERSHTDPDRGLDWWQDWPRCHHWEDALREVEPDPAGNVAAILDRPTLQDVWPAELQVVTPFKKAHASASTWPVRGARPSNLLARAERFLVESPVPSPSHAELRVLRSLLGRHPRMGQDLVCFPNSIHGVLLHSPFWLRPLATWSRPAGDGHQVLRSLLDHLFVLYEVPHFFYDSWDGNPLFFVLVAQGERPARAAKLFGWTPPDRYWRHLLAQTGARSFSSAVRIAWLRYLSVPAAVWQRVNRLGFRFSFMRVDVLGLDEYAQDTLRWLAAHIQALDDRDLLCVLHWAEHRRIEGECGRKTWFRWASWSPVGALHAAREYERERDQASQSLFRPPIRVWVEHGWNAEHESPGVSRWQFQELTSSEDLRDEGSKMHHCVGSYAHRCATGRSAIFSLRRDGVRALTIEVDPETPRLRQVFGSFNRPPTEMEAGIVERWYNELVSRE